MDQPVLMLNILKFKDLTVHVFRDASDAATPSLSLSLDASGSSAL